MTTVSGLNTPMLSLLSMLNQNSADIDQTSLRLSTGKRVNSARDDAPAFFKAQSYSALSAQLTQLTTGGQVVTRAMKAAQSGLDTIKQQLQSLSKTIADAQAAATDAAASRAVSTAAYASSSASLVGSGASRFNEGDVFSIAVGASGTKVYFSATASAPAGGATGAGTQASPLQVGTVQDLISALGRTTFANGSKTHAVTGALTGGQLVLSSDDTMTIALETNAANTPVNDIGAMFSGLSTAALGRSTSTASFGVSTTSVTALKQRETAHQLYQSTLRLIDQTVRDAGMGQVGNVLATDTGGAGQVLSVDLSTGSDRAFSFGFATGSDSAGLGLTPGYTSRFAQDGDLQSAATAVSQALDTIDLRLKAIASNQALVDQRLAFNKTMATTLDQAVVDLTGANADEDTLQLNAQQATRQMAIKMIAARTQSTQMLLSLL